MYFFFGNFIFEEFTDDDDGVRRFITDVVFSHEDDVCYARYVIKGEKDIKKNHDYTILRHGKGWWR